jgi:hypothetical protein
VRWPIGFRKRLGGLDARVRKLLDASSRRDGPSARHVKVGSVIVREYQGKLHEVMVVPGGFCWQEQIFASLSTIARKITGTSWNGPRFFGLRGGEDAPAADAGAPAPAQADTRPVQRSGSIPARPCAQHRRGTA